LSAPLRVWLITDEKPGHKNQLKGLAQSLGRLTAVDISWIGTDKLDVHWWQLINRKKLSAIQQAVSKLNAHQATSLDIEAAAPDMVIGAGHATHKALLALKKVYHSFSVVLMKPSLPYRFFDAAVIPSHDSPPERADILSTQGVLNVVRPNTGPRDEDGLILIGGISKHYEWSSEKVVASVTTIIEKDQRHWHLTNSRRTPDDFMPSLQTKLAQLQLTSRVTLWPYQETPPSWLPEQLKSTNRVWVTPDSVSMVYEALTSSAPTGIIELTPSRQGRIVRGIEKLIAEKKLSTVSAWLTSGVICPPAIDFCEADKAANWLLKMYRTRNKTT
jgi:hypothetical protein